MADCDLCGTKIGIFDAKFRCKGGCRGTYCFDCMTTPITSAMREELVFLTDSAKIPDMLQTEFSFIKMNNVACKKCVNSDYRQILFIYDELKDVFDNISLYPHTYKGKILYDNKTSLKIKSDFFKNKIDTEKDLKRKAIGRGHDIIYDVKWIKEERNNPMNSNHVITVWQANGFSAKK